MKQLFGDETWTFMQDHASPHDAKSKQLWLSQNVPDYFKKEDWPAKSPDLNPIDKFVEYLGVKN